MRGWALGILLALASGTLRADLATVKAEPNLERRARAALENADQALRAARQAYSAADLPETKNLLTEIEQSVELAGHSLKETRKNPSRSPKHFKYAEIKIRDLLRKAESFQHQMSAEDRSLVDPLKARMQEVQEEILLGIMGKKRK